MQLTVSPLFAVSHL